MSREQRNKGPKKKFNPPPKPVAQAPTFAYTSVCCGVKAIKPALLKTPEAGDALLQGTLGSWRCGGCGKSCKCNRTKAKSDVVAQ